MEPAIDIIAYLWDSRKSWFVHDNEDCPHTVEERIEEFLDSINVGAYMEFAENDLGHPYGVWLHHTADEWSELVGPKAQDRYLQKVVEAHMNYVTEIMAFQASQARQSDE